MTDSPIQEGERRHETCLVHNNKHGFRGVEWDRSRQKYRARIVPEPGKRGRFLGRFTSAIDAAVAYDEAAREAYGKDARLNFPRPDERGTMASPRSLGKCRLGHDLAEHGRPRPDGRGIECRECQRLAYHRRKAASGELMERKE